MRIASKKHSQNVNTRGNVPKSLSVSVSLCIYTTYDALRRKGVVSFYTLFDHVHNNLYRQKVEEDKSPIGPYLLALFVFVVCGSGK